MLLKDILRVEYKKLYATDVGTFKRIVLSIKLAIVLEISLSL